MVSGTSSAAIFWAKPSTMAVLPTPGSPTRTGLFLVRRDNTCITRSVSRWRPITGSRPLSLASLVRLRPNWSSTSDPEALLSPLPPGEVVAFSPDPDPWGPPNPDRSWITCWRTRDKSAPSLTSTWAATPSPSRIRPRRMCSVPM